MGEQAYLVVVEEEELEKKRIRYYIKGEYYCLRVQETFMNSFYCKNQSSFMFSHTAL